MARVARSRQRTRTFMGKRILFSNPNWDTTGHHTTSPVTVTRTSTIGDMVGRPVVPSSLLSDQRVGAVIWHGKVRNASSSLILESYPTTGGNGSFSDIEVQPLPVPNGWLLSAIARSNPSRPIVNPPEMLQNLIELPKLLRDTWKVLRHPKTLFSPKGVANNFLMVKFGWKPMIDDIIKVLDLQKEVTKRTSELNRLYTGKGLRRRLTLGSTTLERASSSMVALSGANTGVSLRYSQICRKDVWATVRWKPLKPPPYHPQDSRYQHEVRKIVLGLTPEGLANGLWKVIPWTWLIGWFTNIGDYTLLYSNTVPATWTEACLMRRSVVTTLGTSAVPVNAKDCFIEPAGFALRTIRTRLVGGTVALPGINMPFLDMSRLSTLMALGVQRTRMFR